MNRRISLRWVFAVVFVTLLAAFITNTTGSWVHAASSGSNALSGTVTLIPASVTCGDGSQQFGFLDASGGQIDSINLDKIDDTVDIQVCADGLTLGGPDTAQIVIEHDDSIVELIDPACAGLLGGGFASPSTKRTSDDQASAFICTKPGGVSGSEGALLRLTVRRTGGGTESLSFRTSGALSTKLYESGVLVVAASGLASLSVLQENQSPTPVPTSAPAPFIPPPAATATPVPASSGDSAPPGLQLGPPTEPADFAGTPGLFSIALSWQVPEDTSDRPIDVYHIQNLKTGEIVRLGGEFLSYTFTGLDPGLKYFFTIKASTGLGTGPATGAGPFSPWDLPGAPTAVAVTVGTDGRSVVVNWSAPDSDGGTPITGYIVVFTPVDSGGTTFPVVHETSATEISVPDLLKPGAVYSVAVGTVTAAGAGPMASGGVVSGAPESTPAPTATIAAIAPTTTVTATVAFVLAPTSVPTAAPGGLEPAVFTISEDDGIALEAAIEALTGRDVVIEEVIVSTDSSADGIGLVIPVAGLTGDETLAGSLEIQIGRLSLDVVNGIGTAEIRLAADLTVIGAASVSAGENVLDVRITEPILQYSPETVDDGSFATSANSIDDVAVTFEVGLDFLPDEVSLGTIFSADPDELEAVVGSTFALTADSELAYFVSVQKTGVSQADFGDNTVAMSVSLDWLDDMVSQGREIAITKVSDGGEVFTEIAQCELFVGSAVCTVTFSGAAGGFSIFAIYGFVNPDPGPEPQPLAASSSETEPGPTSTLAAAEASVLPEPTRVVAVATPEQAQPQEPTPVPEVAPTPAEIDVDRDEITVLGDVGGSGPSVLVIVAIAVVAVVAGGSVIAVFVRRPEVPTAGLVIIAVAVGSFALVVGDSSVAQADEDPFVKDFSGSIIDDFDSDDFRYRKVGSVVQALSEAYRAGTLVERPEFAGLSDIEALDPSIDVTIWFASPGDVNIKLIGQIATVLNHFDDVVEARVPVRFAHQLSYMPGVLRVDRIKPPQVSAITSEGTSVHGSPAWNAVGLDGTGIKVGIIDVGFQGWSSISPSELPTPAAVRCYTSVGVFTSNLSDCEVETVHGTAVAEAVDDIAPEVEFYISNPASLLDLLAATQWMASQGVQIINHSVGWGWDGPGDGTSPSSDSPLNSVDQAVTDGMLWVNAAGNEYEDTWFGSWSNPDSDQWMNFLGIDESNAINAGFLDNIQVQLRWQSSWLAADTDLKLCIYNSSSVLVDCANTTQSGSAGQIPYEFLDVVVAGGTYHLTVEYVGGPLPDWVQLHTWSGHNLQHVGEGRSIANPAESKNIGMLAVGAAAWSSTSTIESFSSQGPTTDGRTKPDIVGADRGNSVSYGVGGFSGTSQASPHVAGLAALVLQRFPAKTPAELATYLKSNAADRGAAGADNTWGYGFAGLTAPAAPVAVADAYSTDEDVVLSVGTPGVTGNDSDDADSFTSVIVATPAHASSFSLDPEGSFTYIPGAGFGGSDSFAYKAVDPWQESSSVTVVLTINARADISGFLSTQGSANPNTVAAAMTSVGSSTGTVVYPLAADGEYDKQLNADSVVYTAAAPGYISRTRSDTETTTDHNLGSISLRSGDADGDADVEASDGTILLAAFVAGLPNSSSRDDGSGNTVDLNGDGAVDAIDISLWASNHGLVGPMAWTTVATTPPLAIADSYWVSQGVQLSVGGIGVLGNDFDQEGDSLTATVVDQPTHGDLTLNSDGSFTYDPISGYTGADSFTYFPSDAQTIGIKTPVSIDVRVSSGTTGGTTAGTTAGATPTATPTPTPSPTSTPSSGTTVGATPTPAP